MDTKDIEILEKRQALYNERTGPMVGDCINFPDGSRARITHIWTDENNQPKSIQTSNTADNCGFYLGDGYMSYSGSLNTGIPWRYFSPSVEIHPCPIWFFHHDYATAHNGVDALLNCKTWNCSTANRTHENWEKGLWKYDENEK